MAPNVTAPVFQLEPFGFWGCCGSEWFVCTSPWLLFVDVAFGKLCVVAVDSVAVSAQEVGRDGFQELVDFHRRLIG